LDVKSAIKFMLISTLCFACMNSGVKYLVHFDTYQIVFFRSAGSLIFTLAYLYRKKMSVLGNNNKMLFFRSVVGITSMTLFFMSTKYIPIGIAVSLRYLAPIFAAIFSVVFLKEKIKYWQWIFFFIAFVGVLVLKGFDTHMDSYGLFLAVTSAVFSGLVFILISKMGKSEHPVVVVNYFMFIATVVGGILSINNWKNPHGIEWLVIFGLGFFGYFAQLYLTKAFQVASTNQVAPLNYLEVIFTVIAGALLFNEIYTLWSILGILMIIIGLVLNFRYKANT
jgi:drug/metabolite transporter (DMT)-like permease